MSTTLCLFVCPCQQGTRQTKQTLEDRRYDVDSDVVVKGQENMAGRKSQAKGRGGELELTKILNNYGIPAEPGLPRSYGLTPDVTGVKDIHVEVKRDEHLNIFTAMTQAMADSEKFRDGSPTVFHRKNRTEWLVTMRLVDWIELYKRKEDAS